MKITKYNLDSLLDEAVYSHSEEVLTLYTNVNGYLLPFSIIPTNVELPDYITPSMKYLDSLGFNLERVWEGVERCKRMKGYC